MIRESAPAKVNLILHVGPARDDGLHEICSIFASIDGADELAIEESSSPADRIHCEGVEGPNLCETALAAFREATGVELPPLEVTVHKRIPVAAGLGGGSADAAAALRAANELAGRPLGATRLREVGFAVGADVPSRVEPGHALVRGAGELVEPIALPTMALALVSRQEGLATADVYAEADRLAATRPRLDPAGMRALAAAPPGTLAASLENDLQAAVLSLRPELAGQIAALREAGALAALVTGSGPTVFGVFDEPAAARRAADGLAGGWTATIGS